MVRRISFSGHFRADKELKQPCRKCECNGHSDTCDPTSGLKCQCGNNTESEDCSQSTIKQVTSHYLYHWCCAKLKYMLKIFVSSLHLQSTHPQCWKMQCAKCKDHYLGTPTSGHQCYKQLNVDLESCFSPEISKIFVVHNFFCLKV